MLQAFPYLGACVHVHQHSLYTQKCCNGYHQGDGLTKEKAIRARQVCTVPLSRRSESFFLFYLRVPSALPCVLTLAPFLEYSAFLVHIPEVSRPSSVQFSR